MNIAIVGAGISGLTCAWYLSRQHAVTVFEANDWAGGHTHTVDVAVASGRYAIDTGFIVCNDRTYPNFLRLLDELGVRRRDTGMSFSVSCERSGLEYNGSSLNGLFAQRANLLRPGYWWFLREIMRFNRCAKQALAEGKVGEQETLADFLRRHGFSGQVCSHYLAPMTAAIWSTPIAEIGRFPLLFFLRFCDNHGLLNVMDRPQWSVIEQGSRRYVEAMLAQLRERPGFALHLQAPLKKIERHSDRVILHRADGETSAFDEVIFACHSDEALALLADASAAEKQILGDLPYQNNDVILHTDTRLLPSRRRAWAAWNYRLPLTDSGLPTVSYDMNQLQGFEAPERFVVTLNRSGEIAPDQVLGRYRYAHPQFSLRSYAAQQRHADISGVRRTHYCGAYWRYGFHEDGVFSALRVVARLGATTCATT